jgi:acetyltransferase-like isoleucine patch superfamily enzyme
VRRLEARLAKARWTLASMSRARWERRLARLGTESVLEKPRLITNPQRIHVGDHVFVRPGIRLEVVAPARDSPPRGLIVIADHVQIEDLVHITAAEEVRIGEGCGIGCLAYITDHDHGRPEGAEHFVDAPLIVRPTRIGNGVFIGEHACILKGVTIGDHAVVGAGAVVTKDVEEGAYVGGVPARAIRAT